MQKQFIKHMHQIICSLRFGLPGLLIIFARKFSVFLYYHGSRNIFSQHDMSIFVATQKLCLKVDVL